jgi:nicotinate-nucleotide pyrophosphorylase (carboxylating)
MIVPMPQQIRAAVSLALTEDLALGDVTTAALLPAPLPARAMILAHAPLTVAGVAVAREVFAQVDPSIRIVRAVKDGAAARAGSTVLIADGDSRSLLAAERVALNFLQHLSGIATLTSRFCAAAKGYRTRIVDTRKTTPGLRALEKWAVTLGGGFNHRQSLGDGVLIKDNHLSLLRSQGLTVTQACRLARERAPHGLNVIVEAESLKDVRAALEGQADVILLDNMTPSMVREAVGLIKGRALIEVSGGMTLDKVQAMAAAGADFISIGALTHSAPAVDLSMDIVRRRRSPTSSRQHGRSR